MTTFRLTAPTAVVMTQERYYRLFPQSITIIIFI